MSVEEFRLAAVVKEYNLLLPRAYSARSARLVTCATPNELERLSDLIAGLAQKGLVLDTRQESLDLGLIKIFETNTLADVETTEVWWYRQVDAKSGEEAQASRRVRYTLRYKMAQLQGRWLVDRIEMLKSEDLSVGK